MKDREVIIEFQQQGAFVKVTAMDVKSLTEISISGPATASESVLQRNAVKRLEYVLKKNGVIS